MLVKLTWNTTIIAKIKKTRTSIFVFTWNKSFRFFSRNVYTCIFHYLNVCAFHYHYVLKIWTKTSLFLLLNNEAGKYSIHHIQVFSYNCDICWLPYLAPLICLFPKILKNIWFSNLLILSVRDEGYSGNASCAQICDFYVVGFYL